LLDGTRRAIDNARAVGRHGVFVLRDLAALVDADLVEQLRLVLAGNGLEMLFQPIMPLHGAQHAQFQALVRLRGSSGQLHVAAELIPAAEQAGLLGAVDRWVLQHCVELLAATPAANRPRLFVSQSLASARDPHAIERLRELLERTAVDASCIVLELRSNDVLGAPGEVRHYAAAAQASGAALSLSGFGHTTDLRLIDALTPNYVKLDVDLLQRNDANANEDLRLLVDGLHERGVHVIAPCIEDASAVATLWSSGADYIQGNFVQAADRGFAFEFSAAVM
jgi:EAL domain-containing protein (putative c-di-GMP-specific phosphodiesterase class I)